MSGDDRVTLPGLAASPLTAVELLSSVDDWLRSKPLQALLTTFGGCLPPGSVLAGLEHLDAWSADVWDFRQGRERHEARRVQYSAAVEAVVREAAAALTMTDSSRPRQRSYDYLLVLGGMVETCLRRTAFAADLVAGGVRVSELAGLASLRPISPGEREFCRAAGITGCETEFDGMDVGVRRAFGLIGPPLSEASGDPTTEPRVATRRHVFPGSNPVASVLAAPSTAPELRRANTADTYAYWASGRPDLAAGQTVLLVTASLHVPFQHFDALRVLGVDHGLSVETVGVESRAAGGSPPGVTTILQEVRSAIVSAGTLARALAAGNAPGAP